MTFVAATFEQIADDLLTALTGGTTREEHRFVGAGESYAVASPDAIPESVRVTGEVGERLVRFARDIDYSLDPNTGAIRWRDSNTARHPDADSYFYVNYYRSETPRPLTDRNPGSVTFLVASAFARELAVVQRQMRGVYESAFVDLATGTSLDQVAALLGLTRRDARFAVGEVLFFRSTPASGDITVPAGTLVSTERGDVFETAERRTLRRGQLSLTAAIRATTEGPSGRVDAGAIIIVNRPIFGIDGVTNGETTFFASEKESDEAFRRRIRGALERAGKASLDAIRLELLESVPGLNDTNVQVAERDVPGVVDVKLGVGADITEDFVRRVDEAIVRARPAGVRVTHNLRRSRASGTGGDRPDGAPMAVLEGVRPLVALPADTLALNSDGIVALRVSVLLRLIDPNLTAAQKESVTGEVRQRVIAYFDALPMGAPVIHAKLLGTVVAHEAVGDAVIRLGAPGGAQPTIEDNVDTAGRRTLVPSSSIGISLMAEPVHVDVLVQVAAHGPRPGPTHDDAVRHVLEALPLPGGATLQRADVISAVTLALAHTDPPLALSDASAIVINAAYDDTGRVLLNPERVALAENHVVAWETITLQLNEEG